MNGSARHSLAALLLLFCLCYSLSGCAIRPVEAPEVNLSDLQVTELTLTHANMLAGLRIFNPNAIALTVQDVEYTLELNGIRVSRGRSVKEVRVGAEEYGELSLRLSSAYWDLLRLFKNVQTGENVKFLLEGRIKVGGLGILGKTYDFKKEGEVPLDGPRP